MQRSWYVQESIHAREDFALLVHANMLLRPQVIQVMPHTK